MAIDGNHTHFCIYCGSRIDPGQNFCADCGKPVYREEPVVKKVPSEYSKKIEELEQNKAKHLINFEYIAKFFK